MGSQLRCWLGVLDGASGMWMDDAHRWSDIFQLEDMLDVIGGGSKSTISAANSKLRPLGEDGCRFYAQLSRLSKMRNAWAHPDVGLLPSIRALLASCSLSSPRPCPKQRAHHNGGRRVPDERFDRHPGGGLRVERRRRVRMKAPLGLFG